MEFRKYSSIPHWDETKEVEHIKNLIREGKIDDHFLVQEKIHWANFSIWHDWNQTKFAKRTAFLAPDEDFFVYQRMVQNRQKQIDDLLQRVWKEQKPKQKVVIWWELFGGIYPGAEKVKGLKNVQTGVFYTPILDFIPFDILVDDKFLDFQTANNYFHQSWFHTLPILFEGRLDEALEFDETFPSGIYKLYELEPVPDNVAEWVVIRHIQYPIKFKKKNLKFREREKVHRIKKPPKKMSPEASKLWQKIEEFLTPVALHNRLEALISKEWEQILQNPARASWLLARDIVEEVERRFGEFLQLEKQDQKLIKSGINRAASLAVNGQIAKNSSK